MKKHLKKMKLRLYDILHFVGFHMYKVVKRYQAHETIYGLECQYPGCHHRKLSIMGVTPKTPYYAPHSETAQRYTLVADVAKVWASELTDELPSTIPIHWR